MKHNMLVLLLKALSLMALLSLMLLIPACGKGNANPDKYSFYESVMDSAKPIAWGNDNDIYVLCDEPLWQNTQDMLKRSMEREVPIVVKERYFNLVKSDIKDIDQLIKYKNLLFLGDLESTGAVSTHLRNTMQKQMTDRVKSAGGEMYVAKNRWVKDQVVVYMVGETPDRLVRLNNIAANRLYNLFYNRLGDRLAYQSYQTKLIPEDFFNPYPFTLKIPENYRLYVNDEKNHFLSLLYRISSESRDFPDKYLSVYYQSMPQDSLHLKWVLAKRAELAAKYYDKDEFDPKQIRIERVMFNKYPAWHLIGAWKNLKHDIGGGFQTFAFYEPTQKKTYLIDNVVYFPAGEKLPILLELQRLSQSFRIK